MGFLQFMENDRFRFYFSARGLDINDTETFFKMLASCTGSDEVDIDTFVRGCMKMKGQASSIDVQMLLYECKHIRRAQQDFYQLWMEHFKVNGRTISSSPLSPLHNPSDN